MPLGSEASQASAFKGSPAHVSALSGPTARVGIRPVPPRPTAWSSGLRAAGPVAFRPPASAFWASCPAEGFRPSCDRPTRPWRAWTPTGFPRSARSETRPGWAPPTPRGQRCSRGRRVALDRRLPPLPAARPYHPGLPSRRPELWITRHPQGFTCVRPSGLPLAWHPRTERELLGRLP